VTYIFSISTSLTFQRDTKLKSFVVWVIRCEKVSRNSCQSNWSSLFLFVCFGLRLGGLHIARAAAMTRDKFLTAGRGFVEVQIKSGMDYAKVQNCSIPPA
jgi:hypothetical protein